MGRRGRVKDDVKWAKAEAVRLAAEGLEPRRIAIELGKKRYTSSEIGSILGIRRRRTVRDWIRDSGEVPSNLEMAEQLHVEGFGSEHIATALRTTRRAAQRYLVEIRGKVRDVHTVRQNVARFYEDPAANMDERFVRSDAFGRELLKHCFRQSENPKAGMADIEEGVGLLEHLVETGRAEDGFNAQCRHIQCRGLKANVLFRRHKADEGLALLKSNHELALNHGPCCVADSYRRLAVGYGQAGEWDHGHDAIVQAFDAYQRIDGAGHDLLGHGIGTCYLSRSYLRYYSMSHEAGVADVQSGMTIVVPGQHPEQYSALALTLASYLADSGIDTGRSRELLRGCRFPDEASQARLRTRWLEGLFARADGVRSLAAIKFEAALDDAKETGAECEVLAIVADIGKLDPNPLRLRAQILDLCVFEDGTHRLGAWIKSAANRDALQEAYSAALRALQRSADHLDEAVFDTLRAAAGPGMMPEFA